MYTENPKIQSLLALGEPEIFSSDSWPDYVSQYGFTTDDVPALLALFADESIDALPPERPEVWAPVYAWRILGQLGSEAAIAPLIAGFDRLCDDDCALSELSRVVGMIGPAGIPALVQHWQQPDKDEFSQILALDALCEVAKQHPMSRDQVLGIYRDYMDRPDTSARGLNGLLIGRLLDLQATEAIAEIRQLFALDCVDISCAGDLEDVEIELGFRARRSTPKPHYGKIHSHNSSAGLGYDDLLNDDAKPDATMDECYKYLNQYLVDYGSGASILNASELDGFFAALACAPVILMPCTWMPALWGGEQFMPEWESETELRQFTTWITMHYNTVMGDFQQHDYGPLFLKSSVDDAEPLIVDDWCEGFLRGLALWGSLTAADREYLESQLYPIRLFASEEARSALVSMSPTEIIDMQNRISPAVENIRQHFFKAVKHADTTVVRAAPKTGRNDPCPCGSGRKFKKCCGLH